MKLQGIKIEEAVFDKKTIGFHFDLTIPMSLMIMKSLYVEIGRSDYFHSVCLIDIENEDIFFDKYNDGRFKDKWYMSLPLSRFGYDKLLSEYPCEKDGSVYVLKNIDI